MPANQHAETAARAAAEAIIDKKGNDVALLDVSDLLVITDVFVIGTGTSNRHVRSLADDVEQRLRELGERPVRREGADYGRWVLLDYGDFVIHLFDAETREFYDLERLWADAPRVEFAEPAATSEA
ncbi:MAG: ribosome silencing factor [Actinomycetota bacterium]|nr:ribosome silencing factor [Actinomycetota bacterium]